MSINAAENKLVCTFPRLPSGPVLYFMFGINIALTIASLSAGTERMLLHKARDTQRFNDRRENRPHRDLSFCHSKRSLPLVDVMGTARLGVGAQQLTPHLGQL